VNPSWPSPDGGHNDRKKQRSNPIQFNLPCLSFPTGHARIRGEGHDNRTMVVRRSA
jgi:hypothetical protein